MMLEMTWNDVRYIAYGIYCDDWIRTHDEGTPVCFNEFIDNEYLDFDYIHYLFCNDEYEAEGWIEVYYNDPIISPLYYGEVKE